MFKEKQGKHKKGIYYYPDNTNDRPRSTNNIRKYCQKNNILFDPDLIKFSSKVNFQDAINSKSDLFSSQIDSTVEHSKISATNIKNVWLDTHIPNTNKQAIKSPQTSDQQKLMNEEIKVMYDWKLWHLVPPSKNKVIIGNRWVYNIKKDENCNTGCFTTRLTNFEGW